MILPLLQVGWLYDVLLLAWAINEMPKFKDIVYLCILCSTSGNIYTTQLIFSGILYILNSWLIQRIINGIFSG